ncbi:MAG: hypothetical protein FWG42_09840 [Clostridiales bacterium]|nr:hypothetical protein [Clostridiales bacterium]
MDVNVLNDRIGKLKKWEQTDSINEILYNTLSSLSTYAQDRFDELTREIRDETATNISAPVIKTAVCVEKNVVKQLFLFPVSSQPPLNSPGYVATVFAECDYPTIKRMMRKTFKATVNCKTETFEAQVSLRYSLKYLQKLQSLYYMYSENEQPWVTVNGPYFYKFLDVISERAFPDGIDSFEIDFGDYEKYVSYDKVLLWNVTPVTETVASCEPKPAYNAIINEHVVKKLQLDEDQYLVCPMGDKFVSFRHGRDLYVRTYTKQLTEIKLMRITSREDAGNLLYLPVKSNKKELGLVDAYARGRYVPTRGEAERVLHSLKSVADFSLVDLRVLPCTDENAAKLKGIDYNYFIETNPILSDKKLLHFALKAADRDIWAYEKMYYVLSELQQRFYEYCCVGEMV